MSRLGSGMGGAMRGGGAAGGAGAVLSGRGGGAGTAAAEERLGRIYDHRLMVRILGYLKPYFGLVLLAALLLILVSVTALAGPLITRIAIDRYIARSDFHGLVRISLAWFGLLVAGGVLQYAQTVAMNLIGQRAMMDLRTQLYRHLQRLPLSFYDRNPVGRLMTRVTNDVEVLNQLFTQGVVALIGDLVTLVGIMVVMIALNVRLALVTFAVLPFLFWFSIRFRNQVRASFRDIRLAVARINAYLQESLSGIPIIKAFQREDDGDREFGRLNADHRDAFLRSVRAFSLYFPLVELTQAVAVALILWYGGARFLRDGLTLGALVAFTQYVSRFFRPIRDLAEKFNLLQDAMASSERIFALLDQAPEAEVVQAAETPAAAPFDPRGTIRYEGVHFSYDDRTPVIENVSCDIPAGRTTAVVGATGSGKTTLVNLLLRFYEPTAGCITVGGVDIRSIPRSRLRSRMAVVEQEVFLFAGTIEENILLGEAPPPGDRLAEALAASHADQLIRRLPHGLKHPVTERGASFSGGERQLLAFARALAFDPEILILDEATASIDSETEHLIQDALRTLLSGRTSIVIAHRLSTIQRADQILVMHHGRIHERGTHAELLERKGIYARLHQLQFGEPGV
jgi:ATP-binding cassette subfamily B multidrug efflux pump